MKKYCVLFIFFIFGITASAQTSLWNWQSYTAMRNIRGICSGASQLFCATEGGLLAFDLNTNEFQKWNNAEGLASNDVTALTSDNNSNIWLGTVNGLVQKFSPATSEWFLIKDFEGHRVNYFVLYGDSLFIGLDIGISLYIVSRKEVKETYRHLGNDLQIDLPVKRILIQSNTIWAATEEA